MKTNGEHHMSSIKVLDSKIICGQLTSGDSKVSAYFPNVTQMDNGKLLAAFVAGSGMDNIDTTTMVSSSIDGGTTWHAPVKLFEASIKDRVFTDSCKITAVGSHTVVAIGYRFFRDDPSVPVGNPDTGGVLPDEVVLLRSDDEAKHFHRPEIIPVSFNEPVEASAPLVVLSNGHWITPIANFMNWDGSTASGLFGRMLRSEDEGLTWDDVTVTLRFPKPHMSVWEQRACEMEPGMVAVIAWVEDLKNNQLHPNHIAVSNDYGKTFFSPISTGIMGQASSIHYLGNDRVLTLHSIRRDTDRPGLLACIAQIRDNTFDIISQQMIWEPEPFSKDSTKHSVFAYLKFGQPSAIKLQNGKWMLTFWYEQHGKSQIQCIFLDII
ncbi:MAG: sialidase family protein [Sphaerochaetaceae bacterium]|nr:sialidase family protein [Sphaerochaetaceae bacterium]